MIFPGWNRDAVTHGTSSSARSDLLWALAPIFFLLGALYLTVIRFQQSPHVALVFTSGVVAALSRARGVSWERTLSSMTASIASTLPAVLLLMAVGMLIGTWLQAGIVPALIVYGFSIVNPAYFLFTACLVAAIVSLATGSSWSTAGTVGLAMMGLGEGMGVPAPMTAGAIISGAYFGDKMSPLSDTTNLAPAVAGTDLFTHVRHMVYTTGPSLLVALLAYFLIGIFSSWSQATSASQDIVRAIRMNFHISPLLLLPPVVVVALVATRRPALPSIVFGVLLGMLFSVWLQDASWQSVLATAKKGFSLQSGNAALDDLLSRGGLDNMMDTVALILCAVSFGGAMEAAGFLDTITRAILRLVHGTGSLVLVTVLTSIGMNVVAGDQYIAIVLPGRMYKKTYEAMGLAPQNLSRALEDSGTLTSPLVPWNTCGAFMTATLGISPLAYLPWAFLNWFNPLVSIFYGFTGLTMRRLEPAPDPKDACSQE